MHIPSWLFSTFGYCLLPEETKMKNPEMTTAAAAAGEADKPQQQEDDQINQKVVKPQQQQQGDDLMNQKVVKPPENAAVRPPQQKCPRCNSFNTKFCYYNNYSHNQPRYFCKTCRRYWTHGGTLRNVPIGGGCRKSSAKQIRIMASPLGISEGNLRYQLPPQPLQSQILPQQGAMVLAAASPGLQTLPILTAMKNREIGNQGLSSVITPSMNSYYSGGGFLPLAGMQPLSQLQSTLNQPQLNLNQINARGQLGGGLGGGNGANLPYLEGLNSMPPPTPPLRSGQQVVQPQLNQIQVQPQSQVYQMGNIDWNMRPLIYSSDRTMVQPSISIVDSLSNSWADIFLMTCSTSNATNNCTIPGTSSVSQNQLMSDLTGFGPPF